MIRQIKFFFLLIFPIVVNAQNDSLLKIMEKELSREFEILSEEDLPAYYIHYKVLENQNAIISANLGSLVQSDSVFFRNAVVSVRVGDYKLDNTRQLDSYGFYNGFNQVQMIPIDNNELAIKQIFWKMTHNAYQTASEKFKNVKSLVEEEKEEEKIDDFSKEKPVQFIDEPLNYSEKIIDKEEWEQKLKRLSKLFLKENILHGEVSINVNRNRNYFVSTEKSKIIENKKSVYLSLNATIRSDDDDVVPLHKTYYAEDLGQIPAYEVLEKDIKEMISNLEKLASAPLAEPYSGPAMLSSSVSGVFFHEIFGHRIEGHRLKSDMDGQTFKDKVDQKILNKSISVVLDPTIKELDGNPLNGHYLYDDQGVKSQRVNIVQNGILKTFLMSRTPIDGILNSNGHGRGQIGSSPVARQSNLIVSTESAVELKKMKKMLLKECKKQKKEYGYHFIQVQGGFTNTDRFNTNAFNIDPTIVYRVYVDGRPDELVRGVDLIGTPLAMFAEIISLSDERDTFIGFCGAESGSVPVSATAPALLVRRIETQKKPVSKLDEKPILSDPSLKNE